MEIEKAIDVVKTLITVRKDGIIKQSYETILKELEKKDKMIESAKDRIEYYLMGNSTLNDFNVREKELERLLKVLNKAEEAE